jgi:hypothetical protein
MNTTVQLNEKRTGWVPPMACWLLVLALGFYDLVYLRETVISALIVLEMDPKLLLLLDKVGFFFFAVLGLLIILLTEPYLRNGWKERCLLVRVLKLISICFACLSLVWAILMAMPGLADEARPTLLDLTVAAALLTTSSLLLSRHQRANSEPQSDV